MQPPAMDSAYASEMARPYTYHLCDFAQVNLHLLSLGIPTCKMWIMMSVPLDLT